MGYLMMDDTGLVTAPNIFRLYLSSPYRGGLSPSEFFDRFNGVLLGLAVGNLLGLPVEGWSRNSIAREYPNGVTEIDPQEKLSPMDDDLAQAVELGESLLNGGDYISEFAARLVRWRREYGRGIGITTSAVIDLLEEGHAPPEAARLIYEERDRIAPNGGLMRCAPVALYRSINPELLVADSAVTCSITHYAPACQWSCIILNAFLAKLLKGLEPSSAKILVPALAETAVVDGASQEVQDRMTQVGSEIDDLKLDEGRIGHTLLCLQAGLWALQTLLNFEEALVSVINAGGDTDTNGAVAGAVLGSRCGASAIPQRWLDCIPERQRVGMLSAELWNP